MINNLLLNTKVKITIDNSAARAVACNWVPRTRIIEGSIYHANKWDGVGTIRLYAPQHTILYPVIQLDKILSYEVLGEELSAPEADIIDVMPSKTTITVVFDILSSKRDQTYRVVKTGQSWTCDCVAGLHARLCKHVKQAQALDSQSEAVAS